MFLKSLSAMTLGFVLLGASACSSTQSRPVLSATSIECAGGAVHDGADVARFAGCESIVGDLRVENSNLTHLKAFRSLRSVSGTLSVSGNRYLPGFVGLEQLTQVGRLEVRDNAKLTSLAALDSLVAVRSLSLVHNPALGSLQGLHGLQRLDWLEVRENGIYTTAGLENLVEAKNVVIAHNPQLISLSGLDSLEQARTLRIEHNPRLCAGGGLMPRLTKVESDLLVRSNLGLSNEDVSRLVSQLEEPEGGLFIESAALDLDNGF